MIQLSLEFSSSTGRHVSTRFQTTKQCNFSSGYTTSEMIFRLFILQGKRCWPCFYSKIPN